MLSTLPQRSDAVESGRTKLRACILLTEVKKALAASLVQKTAEHPLPPLPPPETLPPAKLAKIEAKFEQQDEEMGIAPMPKGNTEGARPHQGTHKVAERGKRLC